MNAFRRILKIALGFCGPIIIILAVYLALTYLTTMGRDSIGTITVMVAILISFLYSSGILAPQKYTFYLKETEEIIAPFSSGKMVFCKEINNEKRYTYYTKGEKGQRIPHTISEHHFIITVFEREQIGGSVTKVYAQEQWKELKGIGVLFDIWSWRHPIKTLSRYRFYVPKGNFSM